MRKTKIPKKGLLTVLLGTLFILMPAGYALAKVSGPCVNCHTMHNSQGGTDVNTDGPFGALVNNTCLGCHTTTSSDPLVGGFPYVKGIGFSDSNCLAGGYFPVAEKVATGFAADNSGGNAHSLKSPSDPPGYNLTWYGALSTGGNRLSCAGDLGCHGDQTKTSWKGTANLEMGAIKGGHHGNMEAAPGAYRMLITYDGATPNAVTGVGASDYEEDLIKNTPAPSPGYTRENATRAHNVYIAGTTNDTISKLCANCHGDFHGTGTGTGSPWQRHPTEEKLPSSWDPGDDAISSNEDCKYNPFGFASGATDTKGTKYVTCLSCHRAHGSDNLDILRFGYNTSLGDTSSGQSAGSSNMYGCLGCHSKQR